jgi:predicted aconitase
MTYPGQVTVIERQELLTLQNNCFVVHPISNKEKDLLNHDSIGSFFLYIRWFHINNHGLSRMKSINHFG